MKRSSARYSVLAVFYTEYMDDKAKERAEQAALERQKQMEANPPTHAQRMSIRGEQKGYPVDLDALACLVSFSTRHLQLEDLRSAKG